MPEDKAEEGVVKPDDTPKQAVIDPVSGRDVTGNYISDSKKSISDSLEEIFSKAADMVSNGSDSEKVISELSNKIEEAVNSHFNSMKLPPDNSVVEKNKTKLKELVAKYSALFEELKKIGESAAKFGLDFKMSTTPELSFHLGWQGDINGFFITFRKDTKLNSALYAVPVANFKTDTYGPYFLGGMPPAADILKVTKNMILFASQENTPPGEFLNSVADKEEPTDIIPMTSAKVKGALLDVEQTDPACVDCAVGPSTKEILEIVKKDMPEIAAVGICESGYPVKEIIPT